MARRFTFRLETVLRLRRRALEDCQRVVAARLGQIADEQALIESYREKIRLDVGESRQVQNAASLDVTAVCNYRAHLRVMHGLIAESEKHIADHEVHLQREREELAKANVAVKAIERLKDRRYERYQEETERLETLEQDELATQVFLRGQAMESRRGADTRGVMTQEVGSVQ